MSFISPNQINPHRAFNYLVGDSGLPEGAIFYAENPVLGSFPAVGLISAGLTIEFYVNVTSYTETSAGYVFGRWTLTTVYDALNPRYSIASPQSAFGPPNSLDENGYNNTDSIAFGSSQLGIEHYITWQINPGTVGNVHSWLDGIYQHATSSGAQPASVSSVEIGQPTPADTNHQSIFTMRKLKISNVQRYVAGVNFTPP